MNNFEKLLNESLNIFKENQIISAKVLEVNNKNVVVDFNFKSKALIDINEFKEPFSNSINLNVGDDIDLLIEEIDNGEGAPTLSYVKAKKEKGKTSILDSLNNEEKYIEVIGKKVVNKGFVANYCGFDIFIPYSILDIRKKENFDFLIGEKFFIKVIRVDFEKDSIFGSKKILSQKEEGINVEKKILELNTGDTIEGEVKSFVKYGLFLDLGFTDSLLHLNDVSWKNFENLKENFKIGDKVKVVITGIDKEKQRVYISLKDLDLQPWNDFVENHNEGDEAELVISKVKHNGIIATYNNLIDFFIHYSELSWYSLKNRVETKFSEGQKIIAYINEINKDKKNALLTLKNNENNPTILFSKNHSFGDMFDAKIIDTGSKFLKIKVENAIGYVFAEEISWNYDSHKEIFNFKKGENIKVSYKSCDVDNYALKFSIKDTIENPFTFFSNKKGEIVEVEVIESKNNIILVKTFNDIKTLVQNKSNKDYSKGDKIKLKIKNSNDFSLELKF